MTLVKQKNNNYINRVVTVKTEERISKRYVLNLFIRINFVTGYNHYSYIWNL